MKKCPSCGKEFEDSMKFCQVDGTPLPDAAAEEPAFDPYATMVSAGPITPAADEPAAEESPAYDDGVAGPTAGSVPIAPPADILDLPSNDPLKTMMVSEAEMEQIRADVAAEPSAPEPADIPTPDESVVPVTNEVMPPPSPFGSEPPPSPLAEGPAEPEQAAVFDEPATIVQPMPDIPFEPPAPVQQQEWTPPPAPEAQWQNQQIGSNTPFQPPMVGADGANKTLPIVSLVLGILSICCYVAPITGAAALVTGWLGMKNIKNDPNTYGGRGLAMAGMITGGVFFVLGIVYYIYIIVVVGFAAMGGGFR